MLLTHLDEFALGAISAMVDVVLPSQSGMPEVWVSGDGRDPSQEWSKGPARICPANYAGKQFMEVRFAHSFPLQYQPVGEGFV